MRKYKPIWDEIKRNGSVVLLAEPLLHFRIVKAVRKEKYKDTALKALGKRYKLMNSSTGRRLHFTLVVDSRFFLEDL